MYSKCCRDREQYLFHLRYFHTVLEYEQPDYDDYCDDYVDAD